jgi:hypothetical protein
MYPTGVARVCVAIVNFRGVVMKNRLNDLRNRWGDKQRGGIGYVFLWLLGVPIPVLILISLLRGCS